MKHTLPSSPQVILATERGQMTTLLADSKSESPGEWKLLGESDATWSAVWRGSENHWHSPHSSGKVIWQPEHTSHSPEQRRRTCLDILMLICKAFWRKLFMNTVRSIYSGLLLNLMVSYVNQMLGTPASQIPRGLDEVRSLMAFLKTPCMWLVSFWP